MLINLNLDPIKPGVERRELSRVLRFVILSILCQPLSADIAQIVAVMKPPRGPEERGADCREDDERHGLNTALFSMFAFFVAARASSSSFF